MEKSRLNFGKGLIVAMAMVCSALAFSASRDLYVSSEGTNSIKRFDGVTGAYIGDFVASGSGGLVNPQGLAFDSDGNLYVMSVDIGNLFGSIKKYDGVSGAFIQNFNVGYDFKFGGDLTWRNGLLYAAEYSGTAATNGIHRFDTNGNHVDLFAATIGGSDGHIFGSDGYFYAVANGPSSGVIKKFNATTGAYVSESASVNGLLLDLREGSNGNFFVSRWNPGGIFQIDSATGANLGQFATISPNTQGQLIGQDGSLLVGNYQGNSILRYDANTGVLLGTFNQGGGLIRPQNFIFGPDPVPEPASLVIIGTGLLAILKKKSHK